MRIKGIMLYIGGSGVSRAATLMGSNPNPPHQDDGDYASGIGVGGNGRVVVCAPLC